MQKKSLVLDTSVLFHDPEVFHRFKDVQLILPSVVLEELDKRKNQNDEIGKHARMAMRFIDAMSKQGRIRDGIELENGNQLRVLLDCDEKTMKNFPITYAPDRNRHRILSSAFCLKEAGAAVILLSKDPVTKILAETIGIETQSYKSHREQYENIPKGVHVRESPKTQIDQFYLDGQLPLPEGDIYPNEYFILKGEGNSSAICRADLKKKALVPLSKNIHEIWGIKPRNVEQKCAMDLLLRDDIKLVTFVGQAGTGKTLLALAAGLRKVFDEDVYQRIIISRSIMPLGKDIGFLPGSKEEKLQSWLAPFFDNLEFICGNTGSEAASETKKWILGSEKFQVEAITYMRGRSFTNTYVIIDEAQNLTAHELKTIISRVGENTKIIVLGDVSQIDNPYLDADSNGLIYLFSKMKKYDICGSILFEQTERSQLSALAATVL